jgi:hypothetical protein
MDPRKPTAATLAVVLTVLIVGCAGGPTSAQDTAPPDWVLQRPADDESYFYFSGSGSSPAGDQNDARAAATGEIMSEIMRYIGVRVTAETEATARSDLDTFQASVEQTVRQRGDARVVGLEVADTWVDSRRDPAVTVHLLIRYQRAELLKEKARLEALFRERIDAVAAPEREGDGLAAQGSHYQAAIRYIAAAVAALGSDIDNADVKFKRNVDKAMGEVERLSLVKLNDNLSTLAGSPFDEPFRMKVVAGATADDPGVPGATVRVAYQVMRGTSRRFASTEARTNDQGIVEFDHPIPDFVGEGAVTMSLDLTTYTDGLFDAPRAYRDQIDSLEELIVSKKAAFALTVASAAGSVPTALLILDYDRDGNLLGTVETSSAVSSRLSGFELRSLNLSASDIAGKSNNELYVLVNERFAGQFERLILGSARVVSTNDRGSRVMATAVGDIQVYDLTTGRIMLSDSRQKGGLGRSDSDASIQALREVGKDLGTTIRNGLR